MMTKRIYAAGIDDDAYDAETQDCVLIYKGRAVRCIGPNYAGWRFVDFPASGLAVDSPEWFAANHILSAGGTIEAGRALLLERIEYYADRPENQQDFIDALDALANFSEPDA